MGCCSSELVQAVDPDFLHPPLRNPRPTGTAKGCREAARDISVEVPADHNTTLAFLVSVQQNGLWIFAISGGFLVPVGAFYDDEKLAVPWAHDKTRLNISLAVCNSGSIQKLPIWR